MCTCPNQYSRKGMTYRPYSPSAMTKAYFCVIDDGMSIRKAASKFGLPEATLRNRVSGKVGPEVTKSGREPFLSIEEENCIVKHIKVMASCGYGYSRSEVVDMASQYAVAVGKRDQDHPFSLMWLHNFMKRWPELRVRKPRSLELARAKATSEEAVTAYFNELDKILTKYDLKNFPESIYNIDEKGLKLNYSPPKIVTGNGSNDAPPPAVTPGKGETVTVIGCGNALGQQIPPFFVFPGQRMRQELLAGAIPGTDGTVSPTGWSNTDIFINYLTNHFPKYVQGRSENKPLLVLYDGHRSHISLPLINWARDHNIHLFILPAHTSHVLQPLDIGCFGPFERIYNADCHKYMREHSCTGLDKYSICAVACNAYSKSLSPGNLINSFRKAGIYEFNPSVVNPSVFKPAEVLKKYESIKSPEEKVTDQPPPNQDEFATQQGSEVIKNGDDAEISLSANFFKRKEDKLGQKKKPAKKRRCLSSVVSGKPITETTIIEKIQDHNEAVSAKKKSTTLKKCSQKPYPPTKALKSRSPASNPKSSKVVSPKPGTSGVQKQNIRKHPVSLFSDTSSDEEIADEDKCCQCGKFQPTELAKSNTVYFTKWGQCMFKNCLHWTHLKFCCSVWRLRAKDVFYCPCHGVPCAPNEE